MLWRGFWNLITPSTIPSKMSLKTKFLLFINCISFCSFAQFQTLEYDFEPFDLKLDKQVFNLVEVLDNRDFPIVYGVKYAYNKERKMVNSSDFSADLKKWYLKKYPPRPNLPNIAVKIQDISFATRDLNNSEIGCRGLVSVYVVKDGKYILISEFADKIYGKLKFLPFAVMHSVFSKITPELIQSSYSEKPFGNSKIEEGFSNDIFNAKPGVYRYFEDFKINSPSVALSKDFFELLPKDQKKNFWLGDFKKNKIKVADRTINNDFWGFSDGSNVFMRLSENYFVKLMQVGDRLYFDTLNNDERTIKKEYLSYLEKAIGILVLYQYTDAAFINIMSTNKKTKVSTFELSKKTGLISDFNY